MKIYSQYLLPAVRFKLTVHDITESNLIKLDNLADKFLKKWLHIPPSGTRAIIHAMEGLNIKSLMQLYKESHAVAHASARFKADDTVNAALDSKLSHESQWSRKASVTVYSEHQYLNVTENVNETSTIDNIKNKIKSAVRNEFHDMWHDSIKELVVQGRFLDLVAAEKSHISWRSYIYDLPRGVLQFAVNASIDTLCTNANLKRWSKRGNAKCDLCSEARETLHHVLNNCPTMLERYKWRHDSILNFLADQFNTNDKFAAYIDLPGKLNGISTIPTSILVTTLRPDAVFINNIDNVCIIFELSIPFECNILNTHRRKSGKYENLVTDIEQKGYKVFYYPVEIGSRGYINNDNLVRLKSLFKKLNCNFKTVKQTLSTISLIGSFVIFHSKFERLWLNPNYISI